MPFTFSHPAACVPLARRGLVLSALVAGSLAPDFPYFLPFLPGSHLSHSPVGVLVYCIPVGLAALWLFHTFLKHPALSLLPVSHHRRLTAAACGFSFGPPQRFALILLSLAFGALTHILWDSFTHFDGWVVQRIPLLSASLIVTDLAALRLYKLLQHGSTLVGAALLVYWYTRWYRQMPGPVAEPSPTISLGAKPVGVALMILGAVLAALVYAYTAQPSLSDFETFRQFLRLFVVGGVSVLFIEFVVFSAFWHLTRFRVQPQ